MTDLYKDPANSYVWHGDMAWIANDSINGKDVTQALLEARKIAVSLQAESLKKEDK